jgi:hypothetical protein
VTVLKSSADTKRKAWYLDWTHPFKKQNNGKLHFFIYKITHRVRRKFSHFGCCCCSQFLEFCFRLYSGSSARTVTGSFRARFFRPERTTTFTRPVPDAQSVESRSETEKKCFYRFNKHAFLYAHQGPILSTTNFLPWFTGPNCLVNIKLRITG